jgi:acyl-CoA synthetase (AMP-forming)/AMP-acid ligase II
VPQFPPLLEAHFGVPLAGGVLVAMNTRLSPDDIRYILNDCGARLLFVDTELSHLVATVRGELETVEAIINIVDEQANAPGEKLPGKRGEVPKAFVTLKPDASVTQKEIINFCHQHLASFKCPRTVEFAELPKTATAKVQKYRLREKEWAGFEKRIH